MATTEFDAEREAIQVQFVTEWGTLTPFRLQNEEWDPPRNSPWASVDILPGEATQRSIHGETVYVRYPGVLQITVFEPKASGQTSSRPLEYAAVAKKAFARKKLFTDDGAVILFRVGGVTVLDDEEGWFKVAYKVRYLRQAQETVT